MQSLEHIASLYEPCSAEEAPFIAQDWHGGQSSALYSLASTGTVFRDAALGEARRAWEESPDLSFDDDYAIGSLIAYLAGLPDEAEEDD